MRIEQGAQVKFSSISIKVRTTAGTMFVMVMEDANGEPIGVQLNIGKAGSEISAMTHGLERVINIALDRGAALTEFIQELSNHTTDKTVLVGNGVSIRSVIDGIVWAFIEYNRDKYKQRLALVHGDNFSRLGG